MRRDAIRVRIIATGFVVATLIVGCSASSAVTTSTTIAASTSTSTTTTTTTTTATATSTTTSTTTTVAATTTTQAPESWSKQANRADTEVHAATKDLSKLRPFIDEFTPNPFHIPLPAGLTLYDLSLDAMLTGGGVDGFLSISAHSTLSPDALQRQVFDGYKPKGLTLGRHETTAFGSIVREWTNAAQTQYLHIDVSPGDHGLTQLTIDLDIWNGPSIGKVDLPILQPLAPLPARPPWAKFADVNIEYNSASTALRFSSQVSAPLSKFGQAVAYYRGAHKNGLLTISASSAGDPIHPSGYWDADGVVTFDGQPGRLRVIKPDQPYSADVGTVAVLWVYVGGPPPS
jgi:hypothetical protein